MSTASTDIHLRRIYEDATPHDGRRVLIDRLWPRGIAKADARLDTWRRDLAPSTDLRTWFGHDPSRWDEFRRRYRAELAADPSRLDDLLEAARRGPVTILYGAKDERHNNAVVLKEVLEERLGGVDTKG